MGSGRRWHHQNHHLRKGGIRTMRHHCPHRLIPRVRMRVVFPLADAAHRLLPSLLVNGLPSAPVVHGKGPATASPQSRRARPSSASDTLLPPLHPLLQLLLLLLRPERNGPGVGIHFCSFKHKFQVGVGSLSTPNSPHSDPRPLPFRHSPASRPAPPQHCTHLGVQCCGRTLAIAR